MSESLKSFLEDFSYPPVYYANASHGFYDLLHWVQLHRPKSTPNIIMPVYIPAKLYRFVLAAGYEVRFYDVTTDLDFSLDEIYSLIDNQSQMVFAVHFFGIPTDLATLKNLTRENKVFLIEDCAHTLNGYHNGTKLGSTGDFALFSSRKMLQVHCGGWVVFNHQPWAFHPSTSKKVNSLYSGYHLLGSRLKYFSNYLGKGRQLIGSQPAPYNGYIDFSEQQDIRIKRMSRLSKLYLQSINISDITEKRRANTRYLWKALKSSDILEPIGFHRLSSETDSNGNTNLRVKDGYVPFSLPVLTPAGERKRIQRKLLDAGIRCYAGWPEAPFGFSGFHQTEQLQQRLLELPVHQYINKYQLEIIAQTLTEN